MKQDKKRLILPALLLAGCLAGCSSMPGQQTSAGTSAGQIQAGSETLAGASSAVSNSAADPDAGFSIGSISGQKYENAFFQISCVLPSTWKYYDSSQMEQINSSQASGSTKEEILRQISSGSSYTDMYAADGKGQLVNVVIQKLEEENGKTTETGTVIQKSVEEIKSALEAQGMTEVSVGTETAQFCGTTQLCITVSAKAEDAELHETEYFIRQGSYLACITASGYQDQTGQEAISSFSRN